MREERGSKDWGLRTQADREVRRRGKGCWLLWGIEKHVTSAGDYCHGNIQTIQRKPS